MTNIALYGSHNAAVAVEQDGAIKLVLEVERLLNYKNSGVAQYKCPRTDSILFFADYLNDYIRKELGIETIDTCYFLNTDVVMDQVRYGLEKSFKARNYKSGRHHQSHAAGAFYQSPFKDALIFSFDGGGDDGFFNIYLGNRKNSVTLLESVLQPGFNNNPHIKYDLGFPYMLFGHYLKDIRQEILSDGNLTYPGKLMGLSSYGKVNDKWLPFFIEFYKSRPNGNNYKDKIEILGNKIDVNFDINDRIESNTAWDIAATSQRAFEECFLEVAIPYFNKYPKLPIIITGGCGLNILLNTRISKEFNKEVFVGPNPNDCGIAVGMLLHELKPKKQVDITYAGTTLLDIDSFGNIIQNSGIPFKTEMLSIDKLVSDLVEGKIVGVAKGRSEHGPRALGNRSILCNPSIPNMKDVLNEKVKHREWYRPFAPVVRLEDVSKYFEWEKESRWMSFCPEVKPEWRTKLQAINHVDGTARVQTVTREQNEWLYDLLTEFEKSTGIGVLLNTSFNVAGKPILSTVSDAFSLFETSAMDCLLIENYYLRK